MPIESAFNTIADLNPAYPTGNDYRKDGDNHIRGIKQAVKQTFPNINAAITASDEDLNFITGIAADPINFGGSGGSVPSGIICMWAGTIANIPAGWYLCNGTNGTPDLSDRFVLGSVDDTRGANGSVAHVAYTTYDGDHNHTGAAGSTALTVDQIPPHGHPWTRSDRVQSNARTTPPTGGIMVSDFDNVTVGAHTGTTTQAAGQQIGGSGGGAAHTHTIPASGTHRHIVDTRGKYYLLAFIQKA